MYHAPAGRAEERFPVELPRMSPKATLQSWAPKGAAASDMIRKLLLSQEATATSGCPRPTCPGFNLLQLNGHPILVLSSLIM